MSPRISPRVAAVLLMLALPIDVRTQDRVPLRDTRPQTGSGVVAGQVLAMDGSGPLAQAHVRIYTASPEPMDAQVTDMDGRFKFDGLLPGRYTVSAAKEGYLSARQVKLNGVEKIVSIGEGSGRVSIELALPKAGVLAGRVVDENGNPVPRVVLNALRYEVVQGRRRLVSSNSGAMTDDRGEVRIFGLAPGRYYVMAAPFNRVQPTRGGKRPGGYASTFYPSASTTREAQPLTVGIGGTTDFQLSLRQTPLSAIEGVVVNMDGTPVAAGMVSASLADVGNSIPAISGSVRPDGSFRISNVAPGTYWLIARMRPAAGEEPFNATATVTVDGADLKGVVLEPEAMVRVSGRIILDTAAARQARPGLLTVGATPIAPRPTASGQRPGAVKSDWTFEFRTWPGPGLIRVLSASGLHVKAVRIDGVDVTDTGYEFRNGQDVPTVEIELTDRFAQLTGTAASRGGVTLSDYTVLVFSQNRDRWAVASGRYVALARPDQNGHFIVRTLPEGKYYAVALTALDGGDWMDPAVLDSLAGKAAPCVLKDGETTSLALTVLPPPGR